MDLQNIMSKKHHVIVGGLGNLGRHLQNVLLSHGKSIVVIDRPQNIEKAKLRAKTTTSESKKIHYEPFTLGYDTSDQLKKLLDQHNDSDGIEALYSVVTPDVQNGTIEEFELTNVKGIQDLVDSCQAVGIPKLVYGSSMAVTNHFISHHNVNEEEPLPSMNSYVTSYDSTKRIGEEIVRESNCVNFNTISLRLGAILASHTDYCLRQTFIDGSKSGTIYSLQQSSPMDWIAASDIATAMLCASEKLSLNDKLGGMVFYCTKGHGNAIATPTQIAEYVSHKMNWKFQTIPPIVVKMLKSIMYMKYTIGQQLQSPSLGVRPDLYLDIPNYEQTFDNTKIHRALHWKPKLTWQQTLDQIIDNYNKEHTQQISNDNNNVIDTSHERV